MPDHDGDYKNLFSYPQTVEALLRGFVREHWVQRLDFTTLGKASASFVSERLRARYGDTVWKVRLAPRKGKKGPWLYVYLLLEFQSTPVPFMAVRMLGYVAGLLEDLIRDRKLARGAALPAVLPLVIYSGKRPWTGPTEIARLFRDIPRDLRRRLPRLDFLLVDESRLAPEALAQPDNVTAGIFRVETAAPEELSRRAGELGRLVPAELAGLRRAITLWIHRALRRRFPGVTIPEGLELEESMIEETIQEWQEQTRREAHQEGWRGGEERGRQEGRKEGRREGRKKGRKEGELLGTRQVLLQVLEQRFGELSPAVRRQVAAVSSPAALQRLARRAVTAESLSALLEGLRR